MQPQFRLIGLDLGSSKAIISSIEGSNISVVLNEASNREIPASITYLPAERIFGEASLMMNKAKYHSTVRSPLRFLTDNPEQRKIERQQSCCEGGTVESQEAVVAFLNYMMRMAAKCSTAIPRYCLAVSDTFDVATRKQISICMKAASPNQFVLLEESQAVCLDYYSANPNQQQTVLFVDYGQAKLSAYMVKFAQDQISTLFRLGDHNIGVRSLDQCLYEHLKTLLKGQFTKKRQIRLMQIASKTRMILSANSEYCIHEELGEEDLETTITRQQFEQLCLPVFEKIYDLLLNVRALANGQKVSADSIEILGGGSRVPKFQQIVGTAFDWPIRKTINSSEAVARGCSLYLKKLENRSRLARLKLKHKVCSASVVYTNCYPQSGKPIGRLFQQQRCKGVEKHLLYHREEYHQPKVVRIEPTANHNYEVWICEQSSGLTIDYFNFKGLGNKKGNRLDLYISTSEYSIPKVTKAVLSNAICYEERELELVDDSIQDITRLRNVQRQLFLRDQQTTRNHEKLNLIHSEIFRLKDKHPELSEYLEKDSLRVDQYDSILERFAKMKSP